MHFVNYGEQSRRNLEYLFLTYEDSLTYVGRQYEQADTYCVGTPRGVEPNILHKNGQQFVEIKCIGTGHHL
jgi:hypothetical protein